MNVMSPKQSSSKGHTTFHGENEPRRMMALLQEKQKLHSCIQTLKTSHDMEIKGLQLRIDELTAWTEVTELLAKERCNSKSCAQMRRQIHDLVSWREAHLPKLEEEKLEWLAQSNLTHHQLLDLEADIQNWDNGGSGCAC